MEIAGRAEDARLSAPQEEDRERQVLLISHDVHLVARLSEALASGRFRMASHPRAATAQHQGLDTNDLVLLDAGSGGTAAVELLRQMRTHSAVPIIVLSSSRHREDLVDLLDAGADDYISEPIDPDEVIARIRAVLRRSEHRRRPLPEHLDVGRIHVATAARLVRVDGEAIPLTSVEYEVIEHLTRRAGHPVSREELMAVVGRRHASPFDRSVDVHVSHLRRKLRRAGGQIRTIRGVGYMLTMADSD